MQNLPFLVTQQPNVKKGLSTVTSQQEPEPTSSFKDVFSKQIGTPAEAAKKVSNKAADKTPTQKELAQGTEAATTANEKMKQHSLAAAGESEKVFANDKAEQVKELSSTKLDVENTQLVANSTDNLDMSGQDLKLEAVDVKEGSSQEVVSENTQLPENVTQQSMLTRVNITPNIAQDKTAMKANNTDAVAAEETLSVTDKRANLTNQDANQVLQQKDDSKADIADKPTTNKAQFAQFEVGKTATQSLESATNQVTLNPELGALQTSTKVPAATLATTSAVAASTAALQTANIDEINAYPGKTGWNEAIGQKVMWMVGAAEQSAKLTLNPPELGPLQVMVNVNNEQANAVFVSESAEVRKALENGMADLKTLMQDAGVELGQTTVNSGEQQQAFQQAAKEQTMQNQTDANDQANAQAGQSKTNVRVSNGLVDTFA